MQASYNNELSSEVIKNSACCHCSDSFYVRDFNSFSDTKAPVLLSCNHAACESCIRKLGSGLSVLCRLCHKTRSECLPAGQHLMHHAYITGHLAINKRSRPPDKVQAPKLPDEPNDPDVTDLCIECSQSADVGCKQCQMKFCRPCWASVHGGAKSLRSHEKVPLDELDGASDEFDICSEHQQPVGFFCTTCEKVACINCVVLEHQGHSTQLLQQKNLLLEEDLKAAVSDAKSLLQTMQLTLKMVRMEKGPQNKAEDREPKKREVVNYFLRLHGLLQRQEEAALRAVAELTDKKTREMATFEEMLSTQIKQLTSLLGKSGNALEVMESKSSSKVPNVSAIISALEELKRRPCHLVKNPDYSAKNSNMVLKESVMDELKDLVRVEEGGVSEFSLLPKHELKEGYIPPDAGTQLLASLVCPDADQKVSQTSPSVTSDESKTSRKKRSDKKTKGSGDSFACTDVRYRDPFACTDIRYREPQDFSHHSSSSTESKASSFLSRNVNRFANGSFLAVNICYSGSPSKFFVHTVVDEVKFQNIERLIEKQLKIAKKDYRATTGAHVIAMCNGKWYRAVVESVDGSEVNVLLADYGNQSTVSCADVRLVTHRSLSFEEEPPLAIPCRLYNICPRRGKWTAAAKKVFSDIFLDKGVRTVMVIVRQSGAGLEVDLSVQLNDTFGREVVSMRDLLLFAEHGCIMSDGLPDPPHDPSFTPVCYRPRSIPRPNDTFPVQVVHTVNPSHFYFQRVDSDLPYLKHLSNKLKECYGGVDSNSKGMVLLPYKDMPCAVKDPRTKAWCRGKVVPANVGFKLLLVDYGSVIPLDLKIMRRLHPQFLKCPPLALQASLSDLLPVIGAWTNKAVERMRVLTQNKTLSAVVVRVSHEVSQVLLFEPTTNTSIHQYLVAEGFGETAAGVSAEQMSRTRPVKLNGKQWKTHMQQARQQPIAPNQPQVEVEVSEKADEEEPDDYIGIEVEVVKSLSPAIVYFVLDNLHTSLFKMSRVLKQHYHGCLADEDAKWVVGQDCAFFSSGSQQWRRGTVEEISAEGIKVLATDLLESELVDPSNMRELSDEHKKEKILFKCHLAGIKPAGPSWTSLAIEELEDQFKDTEKLYMCRKGDFTGLSLPVEFFVQETIFGGALKPTRTNFRSINETLVKKGLAYPVEGYKFGQFALSAQQEKDEISEKLSGSVGAASTSDETCPSPAVKTVLPSVLQQWRPPKPITKKRVLGWTTFADERGVLYFHNFKTERPVLEKIQKELTAVYWDSRPDHKDQFWTVGQICVARYHWDHAWYRGKIIEVGWRGTRKYLVLFVDYGNLETCDVTDLRKGVACLDIPIVCHSCYISDLRPKNGRLETRKDVDNFHSCGVDREFIIDVLGSSTEPFPARLAWVGSASDVFELMVELNLMVRVNPSKPYQLPPRDMSGEECVEYPDDLTPPCLSQPTTSLLAASQCSLSPVKSESERSVRSEVAPERELFTSSKDEAEPESSDLLEISREEKTATPVEAAVQDEQAPLQNVKSRPWSEIILEEELITEVTPWHYETLSIPDTLKYVTVSVTHVDESTMFARVVADGATPPDLLAALRQRKSIETDMEVIGPLLPRLVAPAPGLACVALREGLFCRGVIETPDRSQPDCLNVLFVDYGNRLRLPLDKVLFCRKEWLQLPSMAVSMKLAEPPLDSYPFMMKLLKAGPTVAEITQCYKDHLVVNFLEVLEGSPVCEALEDPSSEFEAVGEQPLQPAGPSVELEAVEEAQAAEAETSVEADEPPQSRRDGLATTKVRGVPRHRRGGRRSMKRKSS